MRISQVNYEVNFNLCMEKTGPKLLQYAETNQKRCAHKLMQYLIVSNNYIILHFGMIQQPFHVASCRSYNVTRSPAVARMAHHTGPVVKLSYLRELV